MKFFGPGWEGPVVDHQKPVLTPVGDTCPVCETTIELGDQGVVIPCLTAGEEPLDQGWHRECFLRSVGARTGG